MQQSEGREVGGDRRLERAHPPDQLSQGRGCRAGSGALRTVREVKLSSAVIDCDSITS